MDPQLNREIQAAYEVYERAQTMSNNKVACILGAILVPAGTLLDWFVYPDLIWDFLWLRLGCAFIMAVSLPVMLSQVGLKIYRYFGIYLLMLPTVIMSYMIFKTEGTRSPYYAGLNLVVLILGLVLQWTFRQSLISVVMVLGLYLTACLLHGGPLEGGMFFNNLYFLTLTGISVATGSYFLGQLRFRDFASRFELDRSRLQLEESHRKLMELDQLKSRFFGNISHELRTPLALMLGPLEDLIKQHQQNLAAGALQNLEMMRANGLRLLKLINDLLELVRLDAGVVPVKTEPVILAEFIPSLVNSAQHLAEKRQLTLEHRVAPDLGCLMVDRDKLEKILLNLQFNALKFTPAGGRVTIRADRENQEVVLRVEDTGKGIAEKNLPHVFSRFWQGDDSTQRKYKGVGIGLALVKELTEVQGGTVAVASREHQGTTFTIRLPYLPAVAQPAPAEAPPTPSPETTASSTTLSQEWLSSLYREADLAVQPDTGSAKVPEPETDADLSKPLVLVADDEPDLRHFLRLQLQQKYRVVETVDGRQALEATRRLMPDLLLLDIMMPEMDGIEVCRTLRQEPATRTLPIILFTARADEQTKLSALTDGATDFLPKPFGITELNLRVKNLMAVHLSEKLLASQKLQLEAALHQLKEAEAQLVQAEKLAALGRMSAGIIHEINNPLNYATTGLYSLRQRLGNVPPDARAALETLLAEVEDGVKRVMNIVRDLRPFASDRDISCDHTDIRHMVDLALRFISHEYREAVQVEVDIAPGLVGWANRVRLVQVLVNLLQNSLDALREKPPVDAAPAIWIRGWEEGGRCRLTLRDNGPGIPPEIQAKIFEPFFTTKEIGDGIGLGLHISHRILQQHGGTITVRSEPGLFTEFTLDFPVTQGQAPPTNHAPTHEP